MFCSIDRALGDALQIDRELEDQRAVGLVDRGDLVVLGRGGGGREGRRREDEQDGYQAPEAHPSPPGWSRCRSRRCRAEDARRRPARRGRGSRGRRPRSPSPAGRRRGQRHGADLVEQLPRGGEVRASVVGLRGHVGAPPARCGGWSSEGEAPVCGGPRSVVEVVRLRGHRARGRSWSGSRSSAPASCSSASGVVVVGRGWSSSARASWSSARRSSSAWSSCSAASVVDVSSVARRERSGPRDGGRGRTSPSSGVDGIVGRARAGGRRRRRVRCGRPRPRLVGPLVARQLLVDVARVRARRLSRSARVRALAAVAGRRPRVPRRARPARARPGSGRPGLARPARAGTTRRRRGRDLLLHLGDGLADRPALAGPDRLVLAVRATRRSARPPTSAAARASAAAGRARRCRVDQRTSPRPAIRPTRLRLSAIAATGSTSSAMRSTSAAASAGSAPSARGSSTCSANESQTVARIRGAAQHHHPKRKPAAGPASRGRR